MSAAAEGLREMTPNDFQAAVIKATLSRRYRRIGCVGGWGVGKSSLVCMLIQALWEDRPGEDVMVVTDKLGRAVRTIDQEAGSILVPRGWRYVTSSHGIMAPHWLSPDGSTKVWMMSYQRPSAKDASANSLEGPTVGAVIMDECQLLPPEALRAALGRARGGVAPLLVALGKPSGDQYWQRWAESHPEGLGLTASAWVNRHNIPAYDDWVASMDAEDAKHNLHCQPRSPELAVFKHWSQDTWPAGNIAPAGWAPGGGRTWAAFDFGIRFPAALVVTHDPELDADVVWAEAMPDETPITEVCGILRAGLPARGVPGLVPRHRVGRPESAGAHPLDLCYGDSAGFARRDDAQMTSSAVDVAGVLGVRCHRTTSAEWRPPHAGIELVKRLVRSPSGQRRLLCCPRLWGRGIESAGRSFAKMVLGYRWADAAREKPHKGPSGHDHAADALRYWAIGARRPDVASMADAREAFSRGGGVEPMGWGDDLR